LAAVSRSRSGSSRLAEVAAVRVDWVGGGVPVWIEYCPSRRWALVPPEVVTVTWSVPSPAGATAVMLVSLFTVKVATGWPGRSDGARAGEVGAVTTTEVPATQSSGSVP